MSDKMRMSAVRRSNRFRVVMNTPLRIGLKQGTLVDISTTGVLATHSGTLKTGGTVSFVVSVSSFASRINALSVRF